MVLDGDDEEEATRWQCVKCGYGNVGCERCLHCGAKAPAEARALGGLHVDVGPAGPNRSAVAGRRAGRTIAALLIVLIGPVVEELVFRGFLAEALRGRGRRGAVLLSAAAFSLAHLRLAQFRYYLFLGVVLA